MRTARLLILLSGLFLCSQMVYPQLPESVYDYQGIPADSLSDLNDSLTPLPGMQARIRLPRYFEPFAYEASTGFIHPGSATTLFAFRYPGMAYTAYTSMLTEATFAEQGAELLETLQLSLPGGKAAIVYILRFQTDTGKGIRFMYFTGDYQTTYYLIASTPEVVSSLLRNVILLSFQTLDY